MSTYSPVKTEKSKCITCILPKGAATPLLEALKREKSVTTATVNRARGASTVAAKGFGSTIEKDICAIIISNTRADEIFEFVYDKAEIGTKPGGFIYQADLAKSVPFVLPDLPEEK